MIGADKDGSMIRYKELVNKLKIYDYVDFTNILSKKKIGLIYHRN